MEQRTTRVRSDPERRSEKEGRPAEMLNGDDPVARVQAVRRSVGMPDWHGHCHKPQSCCRHLGWCGRWRMAPLVVSGAARVGARLIVAVTVVSALAARSPLGGGSLPTETRHRRSEGTDHEHQQEGCHSLHPSMMCRNPGVVNFAEAQRRVLYI